MIFTEGKHLFENRTFKNSSFSEVSVLQEKFENNPNICAEFRNTPCSISLEKKRIENKKIESIITRHQVIFLLRYLDLNL